MADVAGKPAATDKSQDYWEFSESESWSNHEKEVTGKLVASSNLGKSENSRAGSRKWPRNFHMSPAVVPRMDKVYSIVRKIYGRSPTDGLNDLDENNAICLGRDFMENLRFTKNQLLKSVKQLFQVTEKLLKDQSEISGLTTIDSKEPTWRSTTLQCDKAIEITNAKTYVFADSVPCLGSMSDQPVEA